MALRRRTSTGSSPHASASLSICPSWAKQACTTPNPRIAPHGRWLVRTAHPSTTAFGHRYGPWHSVTALTSTADDVDAYAPPSSTKRASSLTISPAAVAWWRIQILAGWRWTWPRKLSARV